MKEQSQALAARLKPFRSLVKKASYVPREDAVSLMYMPCVRSAFVKAYNFAELATHQDGQNALFLVSALRSTTEELIVLNYLSGMSHIDRESVLQILFELEMVDKAKIQSRFFGKFRPFQPVVSLPAKTAKRKLQEEELREIWRRNGFPKFNKPNYPIVPPTYKIARNSEAGMLEIVYDYIYRLSSHAVHFQPSSLLRLGWMSNSTEDYVFSPKQFTPHFTTVNQIYGCFLFCLFLELFEDVVKPTQTENEALGKLRKQLLQEFRWPEMVTHEEMNYSAPSVSIINELYHTCFSVFMLEGFLTGAKKLLDSKDIKDLIDRLP